MLRVVTGDEPPEERARAETIEGILKCATAAGLTDCMVIGYSERGFFCGLSVTDALRGLGLLDLARLTILDDLSDRAADDLDDEC